MTKNPYPGRFIVFEGLDGAGTTTQADLLLKYLRGKNIKAHLTREPTQYLVGWLIRSWLAGDWRSTPECLQLLFTADRAYHLDKEVIPLLKKGITVICDRYFFSTVAYGGLEIKDENWLTDLNKRFILPDLTIILKVRPEECLRRIKSGRFSVELFENKRKLEKVWQNYSKVAKNFRNIKILDGEKDIHQISEKIKELIELRNVMGNNISKS